MALTASYIAPCMMAKLRVGWMVAGCAPGVRTMTRSVLFHCTTWLTGFDAWAIAGARFAAASTARVVPASNRVFISVLRSVLRDVDREFEPVDPAVTIPHSGRRVGFPVARRHVHQSTSRPLRKVLEPSFSPRSERPAHFDHGWL